jgi:serine/threonine protein kinase/tetratricopeptide (TPR) repeat protein
MAATVSERLNRALDGRYVLERQIGEGGMGAVFVAHDPRHERRVAIKVFRPEVAQSLGSDRFLREIRTVARLDHPNILALIDSGDADGLLYFVMPLVDGESLRDRMTRERQLPLGDAIRIIAQVADGLDHSHRHGIVHRDIKPENILLSGEHAKLADFGIARTSADSADRLTLTGMSIGTPAYMSPEQIVGDEAVDGRSDLYSLGCVLFEMLAGSPPFSGSTPQAILAKRLMQDPDPVSRHRPGVSAMVDLVIARALSREAGERHATAREFAAALLAEVSGINSRPAAASIGQAESPRRARLVGRDREMEEARTLLAGLAAGRGGLLLVGGEPGVGKTRLAQTILDEARSLGALCLVGRCYEMEGTPPFTPYIELLDYVARSIPARTLRDALGDAAPEVARILPSLRQTFPDIPPPLDLPPDQQRRHLYAQYREFNARAARVAPIVVLMDDLHWADEASLGLLEHSATYLATMPIVVIGTYRDVDLDVNRPFARVLELLTRQRLARRIALRRLPEERVAELLAVLGGGPPPAALAHVIHAETDGNPFFVEEVFQHLKEEGKLFDEAGQWRAELRVEDLAVPEGVRLVIGRRLERLTPECRAVLTSAAVIGPRFGLKILEALGESDEDTLLDALEAATAAHLIAEQRSGRDITYAFTHELIRQTLLGGLSMPRRQRRHLAVATAMEAVYGDRVNQRASDVAYHLYQAGAAADPDRTVHFLTLAAEQANASAAYTEALAHCERATNVEDVSDPALPPRLAFARGMAFRGGARWSEAIASYQNAFEALIADGDAGLLTDVGVELTVLLMWAARGAEAHEIAERVLPRVPVERTRQRGILRSVSAQAWAMSRIDFAGGMERFARILADEELQRDPVVRGTTRTSEGLVAFHFGQFRHAFAVLTEACELLVGPEHRQPYLDAASHRFGSRLHTASHEEMVRERAEIERLAAEAGHLGSRIFLDMATILSDYACPGDLQGLERFCGDLLERWNAIGPWGHLMQSYSAWAQCMRGEYERALRTCELARTAFPTGTWVGVNESLAILSAAYWAPEPFARARAAYAYLVPTPDRVPTGGQTAYVSGLAYALHVRGSREELGALREPIRAALAGGMVGGPLFVYSSTLGLAEMAAGNFDAAEAAFLEGIRASEQGHYRIALALGGMWYAELLFERDGTGDREKGLDLLQRAISEFTLMEMLPPLAQAEALRARVMPAPSVPG